MSDKTPSPQVRRDLLFVNKNAQSGNFSRAGSREEAAKINSYAQKWSLEHNADKVKEKSSSEESGLAQVEPVELFVSKAKVRVDQTKPTQRRLQSSKNPKQRALPIRPAPPRHTKLAFSAATPAKSDTSEVQSQPLILRPFNRVPGSSIDPFNRLSKPLDGNVLSILQYYINFALIPTLNSGGSSESTPGQLTHSSAVRTIVAGCLQNEAHLFALLCATAARMRRVSGVPLTGSKSPEYLLGRAIATTRGSLSNPSVMSDRQTILDIFYLSVCEWYMHGYEAARTHSRFLRQFWKNIDPKKDDVLDQYISDMVSYHDIFLAVGIGQPPFLESEQESDTLPLGKLARVQDWFDSLSTRSAATVPYGSGFAFIIETDWVSLSLQDVLKSLPNLLQVYHFTLESLDPCPEESTFLAKGSQTLLHRLTSSVTYGYELCINLCLIALLSCMSTLHTWRPGKIALVRIARRLSRQLQYEIQVDLGRTVLGTATIWTGQDARLLLWILITGVWAASDDLEGQWFGARARELTSLLRLNKTELEALLHLFVYLPPIQRRCTEQWYQDSFG